ncbi:ArsR/SmtB family transcription factor [Kribbella amoyensis]|uniref:ArsR/SmtB family transcription factor n=1 Tax=Kribbella amoyensis TaxID=996641 RepID=UPI00192E0FE1|nr:ArsR family transcriptional regulator [Kribbella amoyensis]
MLIIRFGADDLASTRFAISPLWDTVASRWCLQDPGANAVHLSWLKHAERVDRSPEFRPHRPLLEALIRPAAWLPDFLTPPPRSPLTAIESELDVLRATTPDTMRADLDSVTGHTPLVDFGRRLHAEPERGLPLLVTALSTWWRLAVEPFWPRMRTLLEADIAYRTRALADHGPGRMLAEIHPTLTWLEGRLRIDWHQHIERELTGAGLPLIPSVFLAGRPAFAVRNASPAAIYYGARAIGTLWERRPSPTGRPLARLVGDTRASLLAVLDAPQTTTHLAARLGAAPSSISAHLKVLYDAGLVSRHRQGKQVLYVCTELGRDLAGH